MDLYKFAEILLLVFALLNLFYSYAAAFGTDCLDKLTITAALFAIAYSTFLILVKK